MIMELAAALALSAAQDPAPAVLECNLEGSDATTQEIDDGSAFVMRPGIAARTCRYSVPDGSLVILAWPQEDTDCPFEGEKGEIDGMPMCGGEIEGPAQGEFSIR